MTAEEVAAEAEVKIRAPGRAWMWFGLGATNFTLAALNLAGDKPWLALLWLAAGCGNIALAFSTRNLGVDLTRESANIRGPRRRSVPWQDVQAVVSDVKSNGTSVVRLILENGEPVTLGAPTSLWRRGDAEFERDFQRIEQWWRTHRGETWRQLHPEEPRP